jgi:hypothetical protein
VLQLVSNHQDERCATVHLHVVALTRCELLALVFQARER